MKYYLLESYPRKPAGWEDKHKRTGPKIIFMEIKTKMNSFLATIIADTNTD